MNANESIGFSFYSLALCCSIDWRSAFKERLKIGNEFYAEAEQFLF